MGATTSNTAKPGGPSPIPFPYFLKKPRNAQERLFSCDSSHLILIPVIRS